jgi:DNA-binding MarR family transcriptional regulator
MGLWFPHGHHHGITASGLLRPGIVRGVTRAHQPGDRARAALEAVALGSVAVTTRALISTALELTFGQWRVLMIVGQDPHGATMSEIATRVGAEISPVSRMVGRLARRGLVVTTKDDRDRRVTRVTVTDHGGTMRAAVLARRRELLIVVLATVGPINADAVAALERIGDGFRMFT